MYYHLCAICRCIAPVCRKFAFSVYLRATDNFANVQRWLNHSLASTFVFLIRSGVWQREKWVSSLLYVLWILLRHRNNYTLLLDRHGLNWIDKNWANFLEVSDHVCENQRKNLFWIAPWWNLLDIFLIALQEHFSVYVQRHQLMTTSAQDRMPSEIIPFNYHQCWNYWFSGHLCTF